MSKHIIYVYDIHEQITFSKQVSYLKDVAKSLKQKYGEKEGSNILGSAVYLISIGGNDYFRLSQNLTVPQQGQLVRNVVGNLTNFLKVTLILPLI